MSEVWFYHLTDSTLHAALPQLLEKSLERGWRVTVEVPDTRLRDGLDDHLWSYRDDSFLPHGTDDDPERAGDQPILLTTDASSGTGATVRFLAGGAMPPERIEGYERIVLMFDGHDQQQLTEARAAWKRLKGGGGNVAYFQQVEGGRWEKKA